MKLTPHQVLTICTELFNAQESDDTNIQSYELDWLTEDRILFSSNRIGIGAFGETELVDYDAMRVVFDSHKSFRMEFYNNGKTVLSREFTVI